MTSRNPQVQAHDPDIFEV